MATTAQQGYGGPHQTERARLAPFVATGQALCREIRCLEAEAGRSRRLRLGQPWALAHDHVNGGYLGPAHRRCNIAESNRRNPPRGYLRRKRVIGLTSRNW